MQIAVDAPTMCAQCFYAAKSAEDKFVHCTLMTAVYRHYFNWVLNSVDNSRYDPKAH